MRVFYVFALRNWIEIIYSHDLDKSIPDDFNVWWTDLVAFLTFDLLYMLVDDPIYDTFPSPVVSPESILLLID